MRRRGYCQPPTLRSSHKSPKSGLGNDGFSDPNLLVFAVSYLGIFPTVLTHREPVAKSHGSDPARKVNAPLGEALGNT